MKIQFLIKKNYSYSDESNQEAKSGLLSSALITTSQLNKFFKVKTDIKVCIDENSIDREVSLYKPNICIIEAVWVTPAKMRELIALHPETKFVIRVHSEIGFVAMEGNVLPWLFEYFDMDCIVSFNSKDATDDMLNATEGYVQLLPNIYTYVDVDYHHRVFNETKNLFLDMIGEHIPKDIHIGCFGAIRPMKNQLIQAFAAIRMAKKHSRNLFFHMNTDRTEQSGENVLKNIRSLFDKSPFTLVEHKWMDREDFLKVVSKMDAGMQVSYNESFNIVSADFVYCNVPIVVSDAIKWMPESLQVSVNHADRIAEKLWHVLMFKKFYNSISRSNLYYYNNTALSSWGELIKKIKY